MTFSCIYCQASFTDHIKLELLCEGWKACCCVGNGALGVFAQSCLLSRQLAVRSGAFGSVFIAACCGVHSKGKTLCLHLGSKERWTNASAKQTLICWEGLFAFKRGIRSIKEQGLIFWVWEGSAWRLELFITVNFIKFDIWFCFSLSDLLWWYLFVMTDLVCGIWATVGQVAWLLC